MLSEAGLCFKPVVPPNPSCSHPTRTRTVPGKDWEKISRERPALGTPSPVLEGLGELRVAPLDELGATAGAGSPLVFVPYVTAGVVQAAAALGLQVGAGEQGQVAKAVLLEVH